MKFFQALILVAALVLIVAHQALALPRQSLRLRKPFKVIQVRFQRKALDCVELKQGSKTIIKAGRLQGRNLLQLYKAKALADLAFAAKRLSGPGRVQTLRRIRNIKNLQKQALAMCHAAFNPNHGGSSSSDSNGGNSSPNPKQNQAPQVDAGQDQELAFFSQSAGLDLAARVSDDGLPNPPQKVSVTWSQQEGPAQVSFSDAHSSNTRATFSQVGQYVLRLTASDGALESADDVRISVVNGDLHTNLVLWMQFEDNPQDGIVDSSGFNHHGACDANCSNFSLTADAPQGQQALDFGRIAKWTERPNFKLLGARDSEMEPQLFTIAVWFKPQGDISRQAIFGVGSSGGGSSGYQLEYSGDMKKIHFAAGHGNSDLHLTSMTSSTTLELDKWYHIAATWDGESLRLYINGQLDVENYFPDLGPNSQYPLTYEGCSASQAACDTYGGDCREPYLGVWTDWGNGIPCTTRELGSSAQMAIDDLRMYGRPLSQVEIKSIYQGAGDSCNGSEIRNCPRQYGVCAGSRQSCTANTWPGCSAGTYGASSASYEAKETSCHDHLDNDCDGLSDDDDPDCNPIRLSRANGVAPLAVFFDAIGTYDWNFIEVTEFDWDFGPGTESDVSSNGRYFEGYLATHVFETPGEYTVTLTVKQHGSVIASFQKRVLVQPFSGRTICISQANNFSACPSQSSADHFNDAMAAWAEFADNTFLLFHRGEVWNLASGLEKDRLYGPVLIGAYGSGERPIINFTADGAGLVITNKRDIRVSDLQFVGASQLSGYCEWSREACNNVLLLRVHGDGQGKPHVFIWGIDSDFFLIDSEFVNVGVYGYYQYGVERLAFLNTRIKDATSHIARIGQTNRVLLYGSIFENENTAPHDAITIRPDGNYSRYSLIKKNLLQKQGWIMQNGPQDSGTGGNLQYQLIEQNIFRPYPGKPAAGVAMLLDGLDYIIRNNLIYDTGYGLSIAERDEWAGPARRWKIYNNTMYSPADVDGGLFALFNGRGPEDISLFNNIYAAPRNDQIYSFNGSADPQKIASDNNLWDVRSTINYYNGNNYSLSSWRGTFAHDEATIVEGASFESTDAAAQGFMHLLPDSPAIDAGLDLPGAYLDFGGNPRPTDGNQDSLATLDIGAFEYNP